VDQRRVDVACVGLLTDFTGRLFSGSARLVEIADVLVRLPLPVLCWCGLSARTNARLVDGVVVREGEQVPARRHPDRRRLGAVRAGGALPGALPASLGAA
jgi:thymidine kinase